MTWVHRLGLNKAPEKVFWIFVSFVLGVLTGHYGPWLWQVISKHWQ